MEHQLSQKAELQKIAHLLAVKEEEIGFLANLKVTELGFLFHSISTAIQKDQSEVWEPIARVVKFIPNFLNAKVSEEVLGPHITANITYHVGVKDALSISNFFSVKFFTDVMEHILPEKVEPILAEAPIDKMKQVLMELLKRKNYYQLSSLMDYTPLEKAAKLTLEVKDFEVLSDVAYFSSKKTRLWRILATYSDERTKGFIITSVKMGRGEMVQEIFESSEEPYRSKLKSLIDSLDEVTKKAIV